MGSSCIILQKQRLSKITEGNRGQLVCQSNLSYSTSLLQWLWVPELLVVLLPTRGDAVWIWHHASIWCVRWHSRRLVNIHVVLAAVAAHGTPILSLRNHYVLKERSKRLVKLKRKGKYKFAFFGIQISLLTWNSS